MHTSKKAKSALAGVFLGAFAITYLLYSQVQYWNGPILCPDINENALAAFLSLLVGFYATLAFAIFVLRIPVTRKWLFIALGTYLITLCFVLLGKSIGISGYNLNPFQSDLFSAGTLLNIAVFVPTGFLLQLLFRKPGKTLLAGLCSVIAIELVQLIFELGIADVIDVIANTVGIAIGLSLYKLTEAAGWAFKRDEGKIRLVRVWESRISRRQRATLIEICFLCLCVGLSSFLFEHTIYQSQEIEDPNTVPFYEIEDGVLYELPLSSTNGTEAVQANIQQSDFEFNSTGSADWLRMQDDGSYSSEGTIDQVVAWISENNQCCLGLTLCSRETVNNITVVHGLPIVVTNETTVHMDGSQTDIEKMRGRAYELLTSYLVCKFRIEEGWLFAEEIDITTNLDGLPDDIALFNYFRYDDYLNANMNSKPFLKVSERETVETWAHLVSTTEIENEQTYCTIQYYDKLGTAPIVHSVNIECADTVPSYPEETDTLSKLAVTLADNQLVLASKP